MQVAVKLCKRSTFEESLERQSKLQREITLLSKLNHPNISRLIEVLESDKYIGLVLDYASGGELFDYILDKEYLSELEAGRLFAQLMDGVHYLHSHCIVHRDLKLENLLLTEDNNLVIIDFGFANQFPSSSKHDHNGVPDPIPDRDYFMSTSCGSPCYAAPELVVSGGYTGTRADIWSCGVILFAMLSGYLPFDDDPNNLGGENIPMLYAYILSVPTPLHIPSHLSTDACHLLQVMIMPDPLFRASLNQVILHPWLKPWRRVLASYKSSLGNTSLSAGNDNDEFSDNDNNPLKLPFDPDSTLSTLSANLSELERKVSIRSQKRQSNPPKSPSTYATPDTLYTVEHNKSPNLSPIMHDSSLTLSHQISIPSSEKAKSPVHTSTKLQELISPKNSIILANSSSVPKLPLAPEKLNGLEHENIKFQQSVTAEQPSEVLSSQLSITSEMQQGSTNMSQQSEQTSSTVQASLSHSLITPEQQKSLDERTCQAITAEQSNTSDVRSTDTSHIPSSISEHTLASTYTSSVWQAPLIPVRTIPTLGTPNVSPLDDIVSIKESESDTSSVFTDHDINSLPPITTILVSSNLQVSKNINYPNSLPMDISSARPCTPASNLSSELNEFVVTADSASFNALDDILPPVMPIETMIQSSQEPSRSVIRKEFVSYSVVYHENDQQVVPLSENKPNLPIIDQVVFDHSNTPSVTTYSINEQAQLDGQQMETSRPNSPVNQQQITTHSSLSSFQSAYSSPGTSNVGYTTPPLGPDQKIIQSTEIIHLPHINVADTLEQIDVSYSAASDPAQSNTISPVGALPANQHTGAQSLTSPIQSNIMEFDADVFPLRDQLIHTPSSHVHDQQTIEPEAFSDPRPLSNLIHTRDQQDQNTYLPEKRGRPTSLIYELPVHQQTSGQSLISSVQNKRMSLDTSCFSANLKRIATTISNNHNHQGSRPVEMHQSLSPGKVLMAQNGPIRNDSLTKKIDHVKSNSPPVQKTLIVHQSPHKQHIMGKYLTASIHDPETTLNATVSPANERVTILEPNQHPTLVPTSQPMSLTHNTQIKEQIADFSSPTSDLDNPGILLVEGKSCPTSLVDDCVVNQKNTGLSPMPSIEKLVVSPGTTVFPVVEQVTSAISKHNPENEIEFSSQSNDLLPEGQSDNHLSPNSSHFVEKNHPTLTANMSPLKLQTTGQSVEGRIQSTPSSLNASTFLKEPVPAVTPPHPLHQQSTVSAVISKPFLVDNLVLKSTAPSFDHVRHSNIPIRTLEQQQTGQSSKSSIQSTGTTLDAIVLSMHKQIADITSSLNPDTPQFERLPLSDINVIEEQSVDSDSPAFDQAQYEILFLRNNQPSLLQNIIPANEKQTPTQSLAPSIKSTQTSLGTSFLSNQQPYGSLQTGATQPAILSGGLPDSAFSPSKQPNMSLLPRSHSFALPYKSHVTNSSLLFSTQYHSPVPSALNTQVCMLKDVLPKAVNTTGMNVSRYPGSHDQSSASFVIEPVKAHGTGSSFSPFDYEQRNNTDGTQPQIPFFPDQVKHHIPPFKSDNQNPIRARVPLDGSTIEKLTLPVNVTLPPTNFKNLPPLPDNHIETRSKGPLVDKPTTNPVNPTLPSASLKMLPSLPDTLLSNEEIYGDIFRPLDQDPDILNLLGSIKVNFTPNNSPQIPENQPVSEPIALKSQSTPNLAHVNGSIIFDINHIPMGYNLPTQSTASNCSPNVPNFPKKPKSYFWDELRLSASKLKWRVTQGTDSMVSTFSKHTTSSNSSHLDLPSLNHYDKNMNISAPAIHSSSNEFMSEMAHPNQVFVSTDHDKSLPQFSSSSSLSNDTYHIHYDTTKQTYSTKLCPFRSHRHSNEVFSRTSLSNDPNLSQTSQEIQYIPPVVSKPDFGPHRLRSRSLVSKIRRGLSLNNQSDEILEWSDNPPLPLVSGVKDGNASIAEQSKAYKVHSYGEDAELNKRGRVMRVIGSKRSVRRGRSLTDMLIGRSKLEDSKPIPPIPSAFVSSTVPNICTVSESKSFPSIALTTRKPEVVLLQVQRILESLGTIVMGDKSDPTQGLIGHGTGHFLLKCRLNLGKKSGITAARLKSELDGLEFGFHNKETDYNPICLPSVSQIHLNPSSRLNGLQIQSNTTPSSSQQLQRFNRTHVKDAAQLFMDILPSPPPVPDSATIKRATETSAHYSVNTSNGHLSSSKGRNRSSSSIAKSLTSGILPFGNELLFSVEIVGLPATHTSRTTWAIKFRRIKGSSVSYNRVKHIVLRKLARSNTNSQPLVV